ncbi:hypothetical protein E2562_029624 [Oryza meyeriana var. granulata]|uniref:Disease resistance N-terminal domain-containing protein n=1 Tax=Oryza meyeriana var. granulata TaxID=110450 RepID=A0A6G1E338_9ORYZ|nr:hypothetical protein E2562_029624 [Oryza meyeriana var. granulata]
MDVLLSAVASDLVGRLLSFLIGKFQEPPAGDNDGARLQRLLQRARVVLEEAEGRQVTSLAMLLQFRQLRWEMCRAANALDALSIRAAAAASRCRRRRRQLLLLGLSDFLGGGTGDGTVVESLEAALGGAKELVVLLGGYPRLTRQPYSAYLFMERCMFGWQVEMEQIIGFLLRPSCSSAGDPNPGVLPVVGGREVGKRTLVEHVCIDERVRQYFTKIHRLSSDDLTAAGDEDEHRSFGIDPSARSLVVVDLVGDVEEEPWRRLCSSVRRENGDSKVVIICRTAEHATRLGTAPRPVTLENLRRPELWFFFRALAFGGADPEDRPELLAIAAELFRGINNFAMFFAVNTLAASLRADMIARVFCDAKRDDLYYMCRPSMDAPHCLFYDRRKLTTPTPAASSTRDDERPSMLRMQDLLTGAVVPCVDMPRFDVLVWQSPIPPYCSYLATCDMGRAKQFVVASGRKRFKRRRPGGNL